jgi:hypothetical protein
MPPTGSASDIINNYKQRHLAKIVKLANDHLARSAGRQLWNGLLHKGIHPLRLGPQSS